MPQRSLTTKFLIPLGAASLLAAAVSFAATTAPLEIRSVQLTDNEAIQGAQNAIGKMRDTQRRIYQLRDVAERKKSVIQMNCVKDKSSKAEGHIAVADKANTRLNEAVAQRDEEGRDHQYTRISLLQQKVLVLGAEAEGCVGDQVAYAGDTVTTEEVEETIAGDEVTEAAFPTLDSSRPSQSSSSL